MDKQEALYLRPGYAPSIGIDDHNVRIVPDPGYRRQTPVQVLKPRLPDAHQRQDPCQSRSLPSLLRVHACVPLPLSCVVIDVRLRDVLVSFHSGTPSRPAFDPATK